MTDTAKQRHEADEAPHASDAAPGAKHKTDDGQPPEAKRPKKEEGDDKKQKTIEETLGVDTDAKDQANEQNGKKTDDKNSAKTEEGQDGKAEAKATEEDHDESAAAAAKNGTAEQPGGREGGSPSSNILEKGIIYFFFRGRVGIDDPKAVDDVARTYFILRPLAPDAKLGAGPIGDAGNSRLCALPKKVLPASGRDRFMAFVERAHASFSELRDGFLAASDYATKTAGTRHAPAATPVGEGVYAITSTGRTSHLAYLLTLPAELGEVQSKMGIRERASFVMSTKNPDYPGPAYARLPEGPEYPKELKETFRSLRWPPTEPSHLDYANAQFLLVGESSDLEKASEAAEGEGQEPSDEMEKLEEEDEKRMKSLGKDESEAIFADLQVRAKDYPKLQTTF